MKIDAPHEADLGVEIPADPQVLYVGTTHLAWKTADGGNTWAPIQQGMMEDSHVMTLSADLRG